jgi:type III secretion protein L
MVNFVYSPRALNLAVSTGDGVIKAQEMAVLDEAHAIVVAAEGKAAEVMQTAQVHYEQEKERGYLEGCALASKEAFARFLGEQAYFDKKLGDIERGLANVVKSCVRTVLASFDDTALAEAAVFRAMEKMRQESQLQIHLPAALIDDFTPFARKLEATFPNVQSIELIVDSNLAAPNFILVSNTGRIECTLADKLDELDTLIDATVATLAGEDQKNGSKDEVTA